MESEKLTGARWFTSSYTGGSNGGGNCVEVAGVGPDRAVRDSKDRSGPIHVFTADAWEAFLSGLKRGDFDPT